MALPAPRNRRRPLRSSTAADPRYTRPMQPYLTHIALHVRDLDASLAFYQGVCGMVMARDRIDARTGDRIVWLASPGAETRFVIVLLPGGPGRHQAETDYSHLGFAVASRSEVDAIAERGRQTGVLIWPQVDADFPTGYFCGLKDPDGNVVEFSFGQPLGPGADH